VWIGREPPEVAAGLADALVGLLQLDFAFVRLSDPGGAGAVEVTRGTAWRGFPEWLEGRLATRAPFLRKEIVPDIGDDSAPRCGLAVPVGVNGDGGVVAAASGRSDFPTPMDQLLLSLTANHAAGAFQGARLVDQRKRAEEALREASDELEVQVAERTAEVERLAEEQAALRRVATVVAQGASPTAVFDAVAGEMEGLLDANQVGLLRYELGEEVLQAADAATFQDSYDPAGGFFPPVATKLMQSPWFLNCPAFRQPPFLHWSLVRGGGEDSPGRTFADSLRSRPAPAGVVSETVWPRPIGGNALGVETTTPPGPGLAVLTQRSEAGGVAIQSPRMSPPWACMSCTGNDSVPPGASPKRSRPLLPTHSNVPPPAGRRTRNWTIAPSLPAPV
jgi:hypothetical protein